LTPARANSSQNPILKRTFTQRDGGIAQGADPEFKPQNRKKKRKRKRKKENEVMLD
jgi:hypothetical protein